MRRVRPIASGSPRCSPGDAAATSPSSGSIRSSARPGRIAGSAGSIDTEDVSMKLLAADLHRHRIRDRFIADPRREPLRSWLLDDLTEIERWAGVLERGRVQ